MSFLKANIPSDELEKELSLLQLLHPVKGLWQAIDVQTYHVAVQDKSPYMLSRGSVKQRINMAHYLQVERDVKSTFASAKKPQPEPVIQTFGRTVIISKTPSNLTNDGMLPSTIPLVFLS